MRLIKRVNAILTAQLNDIVDTFEKPERMLKQAIREMEVALESAIESTAKAIAAEKRLRRERADAQAQAETWHGRAAQLVQREEDASRPASPGSQGRKAETGRVARPRTAAIRSDDRPVAAAARPPPRTAGRREAAPGGAGGAAGAAEARRQFVQAIGHFDADLEAFRRFENLSERIDETEAEVDGGMRTAGSRLRRRGPRSACRSGTGDSQTAECRNQRSSRVKSWRFIMSFTTTLVFYLTFGAGVAAAVALRDAERMAGKRLGRAAAALLFWPLYLPLLLERGTNRDAEREPASPVDPSDALAQAIGQVESELDAALGSLDGWAEGVLVDERPRLDELRSAWRSQAARVRELDRFLAQPEAGAVATFAATKNSATGPATSERATGTIGKSPAARPVAPPPVRRPVGHAGLGPRTCDNDSPGQVQRAAASRAEELVAQIATAVEGLGRFPTRAMPRSS